MDYKLILTNRGKAKIAEAMAMGVLINPLQIALGDGAGEIYEPSSNMAILRQEVYRADIIRKSTYPSDSSIITLDAIVPLTIGGFTIREVGIIDADNDLIAIAAHPEIYKSTIDEGSALEMKINLKMKVSNSAVIDLTLPQSVLIASVDYVDETKTDLEAKILQTRGEIEGIVDETIAGIYDSIILKLDDYTIDRDLVTHIRHTNLNGDIATEVTTYNPLLDEEKEVVVPLPLADEDHDGAISKDDVKAIRQNSFRIAALEGTIKRYPVHLGTDDLTQADYQTAYEEIVGVGAVPPDGTTLINLDNNHAITYSARDDEWIDKGVDSGFGSIDSNILNNLDMLSIISDDLKGRHSKIIDCGFITQNVSQSEDGSLIFSYLDLKDRALMRDKNLSDLTDTKEAIVNLGLDEINVIGGDV